MSDKTGKYEYTPAPEPPDFWMYTTQDLFDIFRNYNEMSLRFETMRTRLKRLRDCLYMQNYRDLSSKMDEILAEVDHE